MKFTVTKTDAENLIREKYNFPPTVEIIISNNDYTDAVRITEYLNDFGCLQSPNTISPFRRQRAINTLRSVIPNCTLVNAVDAVDNWPKFIAYVNMHGLPVMDNQNVRLPEAIMG